MVVSSEVMVEPEYGNGWTDGHATIETPQAFLCKLKCRENKGCGKIISKRHEWFDKEIEVSRRHEEWDGQINVVVKNDYGNANVSGFAKIDMNRVTL